MKSSYELFAKSMEDLGSCANNKLPRREGRNMAWRPGAVNIQWLQKPLDIRNVGLGTRGCAPLKKVADNPR